jgi:hypothetical protein
MNSSLQGRPESALGARGVQITEFNESKINPEPVVLEDSEILMEQYLSPGNITKHEQHKEMSYIHSKSYTLTNVNIIFAILTIALYSQQHWAKILDQELI